jgi:translation initiation factor 6
LQTKPKQQEGREYISSRNTNMATRCRFESSSDVGVFANLTNSYCLASLSTGSTNFYSTFESELSQVIPVIHTTIAGTRIIGRLTCGGCPFSTP